MITVERTFRVPSPLDAVFAYLADFTTTEQWDPGTVTTTRTDNRPLGRGATFANVSTYRGKQTELTYTLATYDPGRHLVFEGTNRSVDSADDLTLNATADGGTEITYQARFAFKRGFQLAEPFLRRGLEKIADDTVDQMRRVLAELPAR